jgi:L-aspartate oxidase
VLVDLEARTSLPGLFAAGEVSCTGLHGANRLASTSLLEGLLWGFRGAEAAVRELQGTATPSLEDLAPWRMPESPQETDPLLIEQDWGLIRSTLWNYAGIIRTEARLHRAKADLHYLAHRIERFYHEARLSRNLLELRSGLLCARLILNAALQNPESRGCHYRMD